MKKQIDLYKYIGGKDINARLQGVYHDSEAGVAVASDTHILVAHAGGYNPARAGEIVRKDGEVVDGPYPKWEAVIPKHNINTFPMDQLREAVLRAENFRRNILKKTKEGAPIHRKADRLILVVTTSGKNWAGAYVDGFRLGLDYKYAKMLCELPAEGATVTFEDERHAILYKNEAEGITAIVMPSYLDGKLGTDEAFRYGVYNGDEAIRWADDPMYGAYTGLTFISGLGDSEEARRMFREKGKDTFVKCVEVISEDEEGRSVVGVRRRIASSLLHVPGTDTFYYVEDKKTGDYPVFKKDGGYFIRVHTHKADTAAGWSRITSQAQREGWDGMSYGDIAKSVGWTPENHKTVAAWGRINAIAS